MSVDHYAPCPCGNGKKLKFCKCIDQPQEFEKLLKLIDGDQKIAAIDRINQLLEKTPNAAWLLAIKGELLLEMNEYETFAETAKRFHKLKPDNPLGLLMLAIASMIESQPLETVARHILEGLAESRDSIHALALSAMRMMMQSLGMHGKMCMVGFWSDIYSVLTQDEPESESPALDPSLSLLAKTPTKIIEDKPGDPWYERLAEVVSLSKTFRYAQAESKLRAILRDFPDEPGPLSQLLRAQCVLLDQPAAYASAMKLAEHLELSAEERAYYRAVAFEIEPNCSSLQSVMSVQYCEIDSDERVQESLSKLNFAISPGGEAFDNVRRYYANLVGDEVPAKQVFSIFSKDMSPNPEAREIASSVGTAVVFGKQTDQPARALFIAHRLPEYNSIIEQVEASLQLGSEVPDFESPINSVYSDFLQRPHVIAGQPAENLTLEEQGDALKHGFLNMTIAALDGKSPIEAANEERLRGNLLALLFHLEAEQAVVVPDGVLRSIFVELGFEQPKVNIPDEAETFRIETALDLERADVDNLNDGQLRALMVRAMSLGATRVFYYCATRIRGRESMQEDLQTQVGVLSGLLSVLPSLSDKLGICDELEAVLTKAESPVGRVIIQKMTLLQSAGRVEEAMEVLKSGARKHPNDPYIMSFVQYAMQSQQAGAMPGGDALAQKMVMNAAQGKQQPAGDAGLALPGDPPANEGGEGGASKLWLPGS